MVFSSSPAELSLEDQHVITRTGVNCPFAKRRRSRRQKVRSDIRTKTASTDERHHRHRHGRLRSNASEVTGRGEEHPNGHDHHDRNTHARQGVARLPMPRNSLVLHDTSCSLQVHKRRQHEGDHRPADAPGQIQDVAEEVTLRSRATSGRGERAGATDQKQERDTFSTRPLATMPQVPAAATLYVGSSQT